MIKNDAASMNERISSSSRSKGDANGTCDHGEDDSGGVVAKES